MPTVYGEPVGSPGNTLEKGQWTMGLGGGSFLKRKLRGGATVSMYSGGHFRGYGLTDWLSIYGKVGAAYLSVKDDAIGPSSNSFGANVMATLQLKAILWQNARRTWDWDGSVQYLYVGAPHRRKNNHAVWNEWQLATDVARTLGPVKPYAGIKLSFFTMDYTIRGAANRHGTYRPETLVGPFAGLDWTVGEFKDTVLSVEGAYLGGVDITMAVTKKF